MAENDKDALRRVQEYRKYVLLYEALDKQIDDLIMAHGGGTENMPREALINYKNLARRRDEIENEMRTLEQELKLDE